MMGYSEWYSASKDHTVRTVVVKVPAVVRPATTADATPEPIGDRAGIPLETPETPGRQELPR